MPNLVFAEPTITPNNFALLFWRREGENFTAERSINPASPNLEPMLQGLRVDEPMQIFFMGINREGGRTSLPSDEVSRTFTLRATPVEPERPDAPDLTDLAFDLPVTDDDPDNEYRVEVS
jgi:hypothetical protein